MNTNQLLLESSPQLVNAALLMIRLFIGVCFIIHALGKLGLVGGGSMAGFEGWLHSMNIPFAGLQARLAMLAEMFGGIFLTIGLFTRVGALFLIGVMLVAALIGHKGGGYLITNNPPGNEYTLNLAAICALILLMGPGRYSLDALLFVVV
ncbi:MAG: DoxX family protein [Pseudobdellovibrio sp.]